MNIRLPEDFKKRMQEMLSDEYEAYEKCYEEKHRGGLRINTLKLKNEEFEKISPYEIKQVPFIPNGYYYQEKEQPARHPYYFGGLYYIQEPSAMTPASLLPVEPGDKVLDLCAAPGGKSTELAAKLQGKGVLVSNDISNSRAKALLKNIELFGVRNPVVISEAPAKLVNTFTGYFDKILVDAPCSGEGMFRKSPSIIKNWEQYGVDYYNKLQKEIILLAVKMLKPGGYLLYSTCTFSTEENEGTIKFLLEEEPDMEIVPAIWNSLENQPDYPLRGEDKDRLENMKNRNNVSYKGFDFGKPEWVDGPKELVHTLRLWPQRIEGEGHYVALLRKKETAPSSIHEPYQIPAKETKQISEEAKEFFQKINFPIDINRITVREDRLYLLPEDLVDLKGLRILRSGLLLGEMKKNRFEPSQALASALKASEYDNIYNLSSKDEDVIRYLKCESIEIKKECKDGWLLVCVDGYPLGFGKYSKGNFKNKYLPGWRWM
ncbi:Fmu (Sun) domain protein [Lachnoclostridium phytofermentans ISDg]|uniref:Fmu (Sun) domain protein n=1 Tax=Lachnoclostridium phytofermentans (strain ATCC 700394 / DSM 18823 / ISDg) TaxID=357809 RepID=A9KNY2_LACP7|nr:RsmB/NOP family class I SAM-dependent RNA methyltransferase [Lachnoclostridium phytofermentans]ABX43152.1 Fmu (Sun) domain protein [Lachnoclostridium phytofermentans ISDg]